LELLVGVGDGECFDVVLFHEGECVGEGGVFVYGDGSWCHDVFGGVGGAVGDAEGGGCVVAGGVGGGEWCEEGDDVGGCDDAEEGGWCGVGGDVEVVVCGEVFHDGGCGVGFGECREVGEGCHVVFDVCGLECAVEGGGLGHPHPLWWIGWSLFKILENVGVWCWGLV